MEQQHKAYAYWLNSIPGIGSRGIAKLLEAFGSPEEVYRGSEKQYRLLLEQKQAESLVAFSHTWQVETEYEKLQEQEVGFVIREETIYPRRLREIPDAPYGIFYKGIIPSDDLLSAAVIGARECSEYGRYVAMELGKALGERGIQLISGMARGIDGIAQEAALKAGGASYGVLGCGVDICYPKQNRSLYRKLLEKCGVLSLYPPETAPQPGLFPPRNRIVSGLADAVVVIEARQKSGTLITVDMALEQGREVYVVPGRITDRLSDGCNKLLKQGAGVFLSPKDFIEDLITLFPDKGMSDAAYLKINNGRNSKQFYERRAMDKEASAVLERLDFYPQSVEQICKKLPGTCTYSMVITTLMKLCMSGEAVQAGSGYFMKRKP